MIESVEHPTLGCLQVLGVPVKLSDTPGTVRTPPPQLGEHTAAVLGNDLGYAPEQIEALAAGGAVRVLRT
jgi:crotonobetainyl-CoA:carnitine CoA-transferase CaiB-like acyl-CoA transferase